MVKELIIYNNVHHYLSELEYKIRELYPEHINDITFTVYSSYVTFNIMTDDYEWHELRFGFNQFPLKDEDIIDEIKNPKTIHITMLF